MTPAREIAFDILRLVEAGGWASDLLLARSASLEPRDAGLASEIVFGVLRRRPQLDFLIGHYSGRPAERLDAEVRIGLRMGIYQLRCLDRIPLHAAVSESVELVKRARKRSAAGLVNAVLRKVDRSAVAWPDRATELAMPPWLLERWDRQFGPSAAEGIARAFLEPAESSLNPETGRIQDIGSQSIVALLDPVPGASFLDVCAAPGNKTAQAIHSGLRAVACDLNFRRLRALDGLDCRRVALDATLPLPFRATFDRILVDAPCSGTGTLGRNPEIKWRVQFGDLAALHSKQVRILAHALELLAPGGRLVYSTCSLEREENEDVVEEVLGALPARLVRRTPGQDRGDGFFAAVIPS